MAANVGNDHLSDSATEGFSTAWDWKANYVDRLAEDGLERFSQFSATPDSTLMFAGPARLTGLAEGSAILRPIGLTDGVNFTSDAQLARLYEIGSNRAFFTRGKTSHSISFSKMLADQHNILAVLMQNAYKPTEMMNVDGTKAPGADSPNPNIMLNLDSEYFAVPFGLMMLFKTRGGSASGTGKILAAVYLESCMFQTYNFSVSATAPVIVEGIAIQFDRPVPISFAV